MSTLYALVDCNNFFASCERIFRPDLVDRPVAVLSNNDGCIIARSNEVKSLGIPMGIPLFKVRDIVRANRITLFSANFELYGDISQRIVQLLRQETPLIEVYSIDESFIDLSQLMVTDIQAWGESVQKRIWQEVGIPVSIGIGSTKTLAKVASTYAKSHGSGVWHVDNSTDRQAMLDDIAVEDIWGVGRRLGPKLRDLGVSTAGQLVGASDAWLKRQFNVTGLRMVDELRGIARHSFGDKHDQRKSIMRSRSFGHRVRAYYELESAVATFAAQAAMRLRAQDSVCRTVVVFLTRVKDSEGHFHSQSHTIRLDEMSAHTGQLISACLEALQSIYDTEGTYRKAGVMLLDIHDTSAWQLNMLHDTSAVRESGVELMKVTDQLNRRYGKGTIWHASESRSRGTWKSRSDNRSPRYTTQLSELPRLYS